MTLAPIDCICTDFLPAGDRASELRDGFTNAQAAASANKLNDRLQKERPQHAPRQQQLDSAVAVSSDEEAYWEYNSWIECDWWPRFRASSHIPQTICCPACRWWTAWSLPQTRVTARPCWRTRWPTRSLPSLIWFVRRPGAGACDRFQILSLVCLHSMISEIWRKRQRNGKSQCGGWCNGLADSLQFLRAMEVMHMHCITRPWR